MSLESLKEEVLHCTKCELSRTRTIPVFGEGNPEARIMLIGEAPGYNEDKTGKPFVGEAGKVLDVLLNSINLKREDIYIANVIKCRPPNNRKPTQKEIKACTPYLDKQISIIRPKVIGCLGNYATDYIMKKYGLTPEGISRIHGKVYKVNNLLGSLSIIPLYHPAVAVYDRGMLPVLMNDFKVLAQNIKERPF